MALIRDDFEPGRPSTQVPASWFNAVANWLNNITGGFGVKVERDNDPPSIGLDREHINDLLAIPVLAPSKDALNVPIGSGVQPPSEEDIAANAPNPVSAVPPDETEDERIQREMDDVGVSKLAARSDHTHRIPTDVGEEPSEPGSLECADSSSIDQGEEVLWTAGGENGCKLQILFDCDPNGEEGLSHKFYAAQLTIGRMGNIVKVERVQHGGAIITA